MNNLDEAWAAGFDEGRGVYHELRQQIEMMEDQRDDLRLQVSRLTAERDEALAALRKIYNLAIAGKSVEYIVLIALCIEVLAKHEEALK